MAAEQPGWLDWDAEMASAEPAAPVDVTATDPLYILYTSGTTGAPKGVVRDNGGHAVALKWTMENIYDIGPGDVMWTASDVGWVVGHSYIVYGPLLAGATTVLYEGKPVGTPDAGAFWRVIQDHNVNVLFTAPTALRAIRKADPEGQLLEKYDISSLRTLFAAGERLDTDTFHWASRVLGVPVVDHWWQTETGWAICANPRGLDGLPIKAGSPSVPMPGFRLNIVDGAGREVEAGTEGNIVLGLPLPPGTLTTLWRNDDRYISSYLQAFEGYYATGDSGYRDGDGYVFVMGRTDDIINVAGHRLSTGAMEQVIGQHPAVAECAVIGLADPLKGQRPSGYVVLKSGVDVAEDVLAKDLIALVRRDIGAVADFKHVTVVEALPKTRSGKILRKTMRQIADGDDYVVPSTIEDAGVIDRLLETLRPAVSESAGAARTGSAVPAVFVLRAAGGAIACGAGDRSGVGEVFEVAPGGDPGHAQRLHDLAGRHRPGLPLDEVLDRVQRGHGQALGQRNFGGARRLANAWSTSLWDARAPATPARGEASCSRNCR